MTEEKDEVLEDDDKVLTEARERFARTLALDSENRANALNDLRFVWNVDNCQWDEQAQKVRTGRPMLVENRLPQFVRRVVNGIRKNRPSIKLVAADEQADQVVADVMEGLIRNIEQRSRADLAYDNAAGYAVASSVGYFKIVTEYADEDGFNQELAIKPIENPFTIYDDPDCQMPDKSDRKFCFETEMVKVDEFEAEHGFKPSVASDMSGLGDNAQHWATADEVRIANYWRVVKNKTKVYRFTPGMGEQPIVLKPDEGGKYLDPATGQEVPAEILKGMECRDIETRVVEPYLITGDKVIKKSQWKGKYIPIVAVLGEEVNIEGKKYRKSLIRDAKDSQKANNYYLSAEAEVVALQPKAPFIGVEGTFDVDTDKWNNANVGNYAFLQHKKGTPPPQRNVPSEFPTGIRESRMAAIEGMKAVLGIYDASLGARSNETSGVAIDERQQEGDQATFHFPDNVNRAQRYAGMVLVDLIPKTYDATRVIRILNPDGDAELKAINTVFIQPDGSLGQIDLAKGGYDVVVTAGPNAETQRQEERNHIINLTKAMPQLTQVAPDLIMESMDFHNSDKYAERLKRTVPPQLLGEGPGGLPPEVQQAMQQVKQAQQQVQMAHGELQKLQGQNASDKAGLESERARIEVLKAQVDAAQKVLNASYQELSAKLELQAHQLMTPVPPTIPQGPTEPAIAPQIQ